MPRWKPNTDNSLIDIYELSKRTGETTNNIRNMLDRGYITGVRIERRGHRLYYYWPNIKWQIEAYQAKQAARRLKKLIK